MPIVEWNVSLLVGVREIDQHHQNLVQLLNKAYDDFREGNDVPPSVIQELVACSTEHFPFEEKVMAEASYPRLEEHKNEHELFSCRLLELQRKYQQSRAVTIELLWFLCNWVTHHVRETDAQLGSYLDVVNIRRRGRKGRD